jgi:uncharacterized protein involved in type VI secretion and phage assembly
MSAPGGFGRTGPIPGVAVAIVTDNEDPEGMGRVRVTYPWRDADDESHWARIATPMAGGGMGAYFLPEVDDEVLVAFENGDIHYPYVVGSLWNGTDTPPADNADGKNDVRLIRSRSGHEIVLNDSDTEGRVEITTAGGHTIVLDDSSGSETVEIADAGGNAITLDKQGLSITGASKVSVSAPMLEFKGDGNVSVEASGILTLKGSLVKIN